MTESMVFTLALVGVLVVLLAFLRLRHVSVQGLALGLIGAIIGLMLGALASAPLSKLPSPFGDVLPLTISVIFTALMIGLVLIRRHAILGLLPFLKMDAAAIAQAKLEPDQQSSEQPTASLPPILVDTSVIIDGRIADIAGAGFVPGRLLVPRFVLAELQNIADSDDAMRRGRGRRGLDVLNTLRELPDVEVEIIEDDAQGIREVDAKLVALAQRFSCNVLTTDYNLNRVAQIQGVRVLNVNELSNAIRPVVLPCEELLVRVVQLGKERNQGVGYLADGTMIVVENGDRLIGQEVATEVTRVFQTVAGKMIFAVPRKPVPGLDKPPVADKPALAPASTAVKPVPAATATAPATTSADQPTDQPVAADKADQAGSRRNRFGRNRKRGGNTNGSSSPDSNPAASAEDRIIAATSKPHPADPIE
jgi:uncharacterized protein YacL